MKVTDRDVMQFFDDELDAAASRRLAEERLRDPTVDARLAGLLQVAAFTRVWARARGVKVRARVAPRRKDGVLALRLALGGAAVVLAAAVVLLRLDPAGAAGAAPHAGGLPPAAVAVEQVDFGAHPGTIFSVSAAGTETTVVWLSDDADGSSHAL
jgi:hypothetical protein